MENNFNEAMEVNSIGNKTGSLFRKSESKVQANLVIVGAVVAAAAAVLPLLA